MADFEDEHYKIASVVKLDTLSDNNDIGKPWRYEEGEYTVTRTSPWSPPGCHPVGCGLKLYVDRNGRLQKVEGDENNPVTQGRLCPRCVALKDYIYSPARLLHPMLRDRSDRGKADAWRIVSWDEAFAKIKEEYDRLTGQYGKKTVVTFAGTGREGGTFGPMRSMALETPNMCYSQSGYACYTPRLAAIAYMAGVTYPEWDYAGALEKRWDDDAYNLTEVLVIWGKAPLESNPDGFFGHAVIDAMRRGMRLIVIDPRVTWLATRADIHLQLRAGTDTALGMAFLNIIISEDLYDHDFVDYWCYGFEQLKYRVCDDPDYAISPEKAGEICGLSVEKIYAAARLYAKAKPAAIQWGLATDQKTDGMQSSHTMVSLMAITGNLDVPGGQLLPGKGAGHNEVGFGWSDELKAMKDDMIGIDEYPAYCNMILNAQADLVMTTLETDEPYPLRFGMYMGNNLLACTSMEPERWMNAINRSLEFCIGFDTFMNPSIEATCDCFLPLKTVAERDGTVFTHYAPCTVTAGFMHKAIEVGEGMSDYELCFHLGKLLNPQNFEDFDSPKAFMEALRLGVKRNGEYFDQVSQCVYSQIPIMYHKYEIGELRQDGKPGFPTPTGRVELWSTAYNQFGEDPLPYYIEPHFSPVSQSQWMTDEYREKYPFVLTTGARTYAFFHSEQRMIPYLRELHPNPLMDINPEVAKRLGIHDGQWCKVESPFGSGVFKANVSWLVDEKTIHCEHAWWFPEQDSNAPNLFGVFQSNVNQLLPNFHFGKLGFGAPNKCLICSVTPVNENYDTDMQLVWEKFGKLV